MYVGSWSRSAAIPNFGCPAMMYSNEFDDREDIGAQTEDETITSIDLGYTNTFVVDDLTQPYLGFLGRSKTFQRTVVRRSISGAFIRSSVRVPLFDRCAYYYTVSRGSDVTIESTIVSNVLLADPYSYNTWRNLRGYTPYRTNPPPPVPIGEHPAGCGPVVARTVWSQVYDPRQCSEFADAGPWAAICENAEARAFSFTPATPPSSFLTVGAIESSRTSLVSTADSPIVVAQNANLPRTSGYSPGVIERWFLTSPDPATQLTQQISTTCSTLGSDISLQYATEMNPPVGSVAIHGRRWHSDMDNASITYVGVIGG